MKLTRIVLAPIVALGMMLSISAAPSFAAAPDWTPTQGTQWQWQLSGRVNTTVNVPVYDVDGEANTAKTVSTLHANGAKVICYIDVGGWENYRPDAADFPASVKGSTVGGWPDERWLDIRQLDVLLPIMEKRVQDCVAKGFDGLEPDLADGYSNRTGFPLTAGDQITYNKAIADLAHQYGLSVALKNDPEQAAELEPFFDFAVVEECNQYKECNAYVPFITAGKAVLATEYRKQTADFCPNMPAGFSTMKKRLNLNAWRQPC